ncbi:hypothetical protein NLG97_g7028 [Lecanicillium saksenae]|uniref:Uncharacterized protein n=1 Tax=Lecanicillium saksenae TaxID=468837 RepID=A0ACC1QQA6_9HYPO|nr:hypothetical protein NLG97_g7028 [Lecanicillium saksenae]
MDGLDEFEKQLAADKAERERSERRDDRKKHRHRHHDDRDDRHRRRHHDEDDDHRHKRRRRSRDDEERRHRHGDGDRHRDRDRSDKYKESKLKNSTEERNAPVRDAWMTAPSALDIEHIHRPAPKEKTPPKEPERVVSVREINRGLNKPDPSAAPERSPESKERVIDYTFGDSGSSWRMTKLRGVYDMAKDTGRPVEDVAVERFGSLQEFDDAREERQELDRAKSYGRGYSMKDKPTGDFYTERLAKQKAAEPAPRARSPEPMAATPAAAVIAPAMDQTALNRLRAQMMKAKLRRAPNAAQLEEEYNRAAAGFTSTATAAQSVVLGGQDSRLLAGNIRNEVKAVDNKRGRERGTVVANDDMTIDDMLREERRQV